MPLDHDDGAAVREKWPVLIYRLQSHRGWEVYCDPDVAVSSSSSSSSSSSLGKKNTNNNSSAATSTSKRVGGGDINDSGKQNGAKSKNSSSTTIVEELTAAPREGCIEVRKMRLRIRLFAQHKPWDTNTTVANATSSSSTSASKRSSSSSSSNLNNNGSASRGGENKNATTSKESTTTANVKVGTVDNNHNKEEDDDGYDSDTPGPDGWNNNALLVRRRNTLLVTTRRGFGALVFQFKSVRDCIDFCDRLMYLNRNLLMPPQSSSASTAATTTSSGKRQSGNEENEEGFKHDNTLSKKRRYVHGMDHREQYVAELNSMKRRNLAMLGDQEVIAPKYDKSLLRQSSKGSSIEGVFDDNNDDTTSMNGTKASGLSEEHTSQYRYRQESVMNYIVQLAHSEEFRGFVDEFERGLTSSMASDEFDGVNLCAALGL